MRDFLPRDGSGVRTGKSTLKDPNHGSPFIHTINRRIWSPEKSTNLKLHWCRRRIYLRRVLGLPSKSVQWTMSRQTHSNSSHAAVCADNPSQGSPYIAMQITLPICFCRSPKGTSYKPSCPEGNFPDECWNELLAKHFNNGFLYTCLCNKDEKRAGGIGDNR